eukprot:scaffold11933_cov117-Skeletonema_dohrnii-CCMP3373.AAC.12
MQLPVINAHGVGFNTPSVPTEMARRTDWSGAANMMLATMQPRRGQTYSRTMTLGASIFEECSLDIDVDGRRGSSRRDYSSTALALKSQLDTTSLQQLLTEMMLIRFTRRCYCSQPIEFGVRRCMDGVDGKRWTACIDEVAQKK